MHADRRRRLFCDVDCPSASTKTVVLICGTEHVSVTTARRRLAACFASQSLSAVDFRRMRVWLFWSHVSRRPDGCRRVVLVVVIIVYFERWSGARLRSAPFNQLLMTILMDVSMSSVVQSCLIMVDCNRWRLWALYATAICTLRLSFFIIRNQNDFCFFGTTLPVHRRLQSYTVVFISPAKKNDFWTGY